MSGLQPWESFCSLEKLKDLHARGIREHGGDPHLRLPDCPEETLGNAWSAVEYSTERGDDPCLYFAAYLLFYFATKQCFTDGNKRLAWASMCHVLSARDLTVNATADEAEAFTKDLAENRVRRVEAVINWLAARVVEVLPPAQPLLGAIAPEPPRAFG